MQVAKDEDQVIVVHQGKLMGGRQTVYGRYSTTMQGILKAVDNAGKTPEYFNSLISSVAVGKRLPVTIFVRGHGFMLIRDSLLSGGFGKMLWYGDSVS